MKAKISILIGFMATICCLLPSVVQAEGIGFSIKANIPENQIDTSLSYYDLKMSPGQEQEITLDVSNYLAEEAVFEVFVNTALTNRNGVIEYGYKEEQKDSSLQVDIAKIITGETTIKVAGNETKKIKFRIKMPEKEFDGILLGGFYVRKVMTEDDKEVKAGLQLKNNFSFVKGIKLSETETEITPNLVLNEVKAGLENYHPVISANIQNTQPTIVKGLMVHGVITKKGSSKIIHETTRTEMSMAPNSNFNFPISWDNQEMKPGMYSIKIEAKDQADRKWNFEKEFKVEKKESEEVNKEAIELVKEQGTMKPAFLLLIVLLCICLVLGSLVILNIYKQKKQ